MCGSGKGSVSTVLAPVGEMNQTQTQPISRPVLYHHPFRNDTCIDSTMGSDDIEAQRAVLSYSTTTGPTAVGGFLEDDDSSSSSGGGGLGGGASGSVRSPPKAHMKLAIQVTKSIHVTKMPESPEPELINGKEEEDISPRTSRHAV